MDRNRTWTPNSDREVIRMLAKAYAQADRKQQQILIAAAAAGMIVLSAVCAVVLGKIEAEYLSFARQNGTIAVTCLENGTQEQYERLQMLNYVRAVGKEIRIGTAYLQGPKLQGPEAEEPEIQKENAEEACCEIKLLDETAWKELTVPAYTDIKGDYPEQKEEIMLSLHTLEKLGITHPRMGMKIPLKMEYRLFESIQTEFTLSGYFTEYLSEADLLPPGYISETLAEELGYDVTVPDALLILQKDEISEEQMENRLYEDVRLTDSSQRFIAGNTFVYEAVEMFSGGYQVICICGMLILISIFLLIQNVMNSSMQKEIRQYGLLQTLGTTVKQQKRMYYRQIGSISVKALLLGGGISAGIMLGILPSILGRLYLELFGRARELTVFHPWILGAAALLVMADLWLAAVWTMYRAAGLGPIEALQYTGEAGKIRRNRRNQGKTEKTDRKARERKRTEYSRKNKNRNDNNRKKGRKNPNTEILYMAWKNLWRYRSRFLLTIFSLFLGITVALGTMMIGKGMDRTNEIETHPDFVIENSVSAANFADVDWWYNKNDAFSPVSDSLREKILRLPGIKKDSLLLTEGGYMDVRDRGVGLYPWANSGGIDEDSYEEYKKYGLFADAAVLQIASKAYLEELEKSVGQKKLPIDMESLKEGRSVLVLHDHQLTPSRQSLADKTPGMELYFAPQNSKEWAKERYEITKDMTFSESWNWAEEHAEETEQMEKKRWECAVKLEIAGYLDTRQKGIPPLETERSFYEEGTLYLLISEEGFEKLGTSKKILRMQFDTEEEQEPLVKQAVQKWIREENTAIPLTGEEKGVYMTAKSDLLAEAENYIRVNRMIMGALGGMLIWMGIMNYFHVCAAGIGARKREFRILESIGMTGRQLRNMLLLEGMYYICITAGLVLTLGTGMIRLTAVYMKSRVSYFCYFFPAAEEAGIFLALLVICLVIPIKLFRSYFSRGRAPCCTASEPVR